MEEIIYKPIDLYERAGVFSDEGTKEMMA